MIIAIDFDGTCVTHDYPNLGKEIGAAPVIKALSDAGHKLILWTMRGNKPVEDLDFPGGYRNTLQEAVSWFNRHNIPLWGINENPEQQASGWSNSFKQYAQVYIDDAALGTPLTKTYLGNHIHNRHFVDWFKMIDLLEAIGALTPYTCAELRDNFSTETTQ